MRALALGGRHFARDGAMESESEIEERERLFWEDIEDDFIYRYEDDCLHRSEERIEYSWGQRSPFLT